jgi:hypothetical protein
VLLLPHVLPQEPARDGEPGVVAGGRHIRSILFLGETAVRPWC